MLKKLLLIGALALGTFAAQAQTLLSEGFDNINTLAGSGWVITNNSTPAASVGWFQGDQTQFGAQAGAPEAYVASNFNTAASGGSISNWLISPTFSTAVAGTVSFWARAALADGFADSIAYGFSSGSSSTNAFTVGPASVVSGEWSLYNVSFAAQGAGSVARFAINYTGSADLSNYVGVDTFSVTAVPEPSTWLMLSLGLLGVVGARRRALGAQA